MYVEGDWIYHTDNWSTGRICRMKTDGSEATQITADICNDFIVNGNYVYYTNRSDNLVYRCRTDGSGKTLLCPGFGGTYLTLAGNRLAVTSGYKILSVKLDGSGFTSSARKMFRALCSTAITDGFTAFSTISGTARKARQFAKLNPTEAEKP
jgi:hypothetical protein